MGSEGVDPDLNPNRSCSLCLSLSLYLSFSLRFLSLSLYDLSVRVCVSVCPCLCVRVCLSLCLSVSLSLCLSVSLSLARSPSLSQSVSCLQLSFSRVCCLFGTLFLSLSVNVGLAALFCSVFVLQEGLGKPQGATRISMSSSISQSSPAENSG